ncbi:MAG: GNAT family N-acetyltransferase [Thermomicrobiales bacterium]
MPMDQPDAQTQVAALASALALPAGVTVRAWMEDDFPAVQQLSAAEGWPTPLHRPETARQAWRHSSPALVAVADGAVIGFLRGLSDGGVTVYVAEVLVAPAWRGRGLGMALLELAQRLNPGARLDLLATAASRAFYERAGFRPFYGYRLSWEERE